MSHCSMEGYMKPLPCLKRLSIMLPVLFLLAGPSAVKAQTITGLVEDGQTGTPLSSVQVFIETLDIGGLSESNGRYALQNLPAGTHAVSAARLGYQTLVLEVTVAAGATVSLNFGLIRQALGLDEIIVTGTAGGTQRRAIGNVVSQLDAAALAEVVPATNLEQLLGTRVAGVTLVPGSGSVGFDTQSIRIRGNSSAALSNDPIIYIDGIRMNSLAPEVTGYMVRPSRLNDINPDDIESIEIIKGPAAATLYGTEASNGVIQIITKRGAQGAPRFDASVQYGFNWLANSAEKVDSIFAISPETGQVFGMNLYEQEIERFGEPIHQYGPLTNYNLSVRGGTDLIRYFASVNRQDQEGIVDWNTDQRQTGRLNLGLSASENLNVDLNMSFTERASREDDGWWRALNWGQPLTALDVGGRDDQRRGFSGQPPEAKRDFHFVEEVVDRRTASLTLNYTPTQWLRHRFITGVDVTANRRSNFYPLDTEFEWFGRRGRTGEKATINSETRLVSLDYSGSTVFRLMDDQLGSTTSFGLQYYNRSFNLASILGTGFATSSLSTVGAAAQITDWDEDIIENATVGLYVQQQFDWEDRFFVTGAIRGDDNSAFGINYDAAYYPKVSSTWVMSEEEFWNFDSVNEFRVRGAWGAAGQQPDTFAASRLYEAVTGPGGVSILTPSDFGNAELAPEKGEELEVGFDASLWDDRVGLNFTAYWRTTKDAIVEQPIPPSLGFPSNQLVNIGEIKNWGTETELNLQILTQDPLRWDLSVTFATLDNEITDLGGVSSIPVRRGRFHIEGYPLANIFSEKVVQATFLSGNSGSIDRATIMCDGGAGPDGRRFGGPAILCDDPISGSAPLLWFGRTEPTWTTAVASTWTLFTDWTLYAQVDAMGGFNVYNDGIGAQSTSFRSTRGANFQDDPIFLGQRAKRRTPIGIANGDFARLRELSLRYTVPDGLADRLRVDRASVTMGWRNVAVLWFPGKCAGEIGGFKYCERMPDPEMNLPSERFGGEASAIIPPLSSMTLTTRISF